MVKSFGFSLDVEMKRGLGILILYVDIVVYGGIEVLGERGRVCGNRIGKPTVALLQSGAKKDACCVLLLVPIKLIMDVSRVCL